jgi:hypothetical protein
VVVGAGGGGDKERQKRLRLIKKLKDSGGSYESLLNEVGERGCLRVV